MQFCVVRNEEGVQNPAEQTMEPFSTFGSRLL
ncbi:hypothetical protein V6Z12_D10G206000 [Gossypium hirsutum]